MSFDDYSYLFHRNTKTTIKDANKNDDSFKYESNNPGGSNTGDIKNKTNQINYDLSQYTNANYSNSPPKYDVGSLIYVGEDRKVFQYLGSSRDFIVAIDNQGNIHYIPQDAYVI